MLSRYFLHDPARRETPRREIGVLGSSSSGTFFEIEKEGAGGAVPGQYAPTASPDKGGYAVQLIEHSLGRRAYVLPLTGAFDHWLTQRKLAAQAGCGVARA
jgi:hypothetical protein